MNDVSLVQPAQGGAALKASGAFFVETNWNTYWLNPGFDPDQYFVFDRNAHNALITKPYTSKQSGHPADGYYNPAGCR